MATWNQKNKEEIEYRITMINKFLELWVRYDDLIEDAHTNKVAEQEVEDEFFKLKSQLARRHQYLLEYLSEEYTKPEMITSFLSDTVTLRNMVTINFDFYKKLCLQWHATYLHLNEALGILMTHLELESPI